MNFEDIRPYHNDEVSEKINKLLQEEQFRQVIEQVNPEIPFDLFARKMKSVKTIREFQEELIVPLVEKLIKKTTNGLAVQGLENLEKDKSYLFISTHRDIVMDSAFMNYVLLKNGYETAEIAIGDNLMKIPWVVDLVKLNKTFIVKRSPDPDKRKDASLQLSSYIHYAIKEKRESIWIAQRAGRSKNGDDRTNPSLLKMFNLAGKEKKAIDNLRSLHICPVSISYEYNPCDVLTLPELMAAEKGGKYEKAPMEDMMHMGQGVQGEKGRVMVSFGQPLNAYLDEFTDLERPALFNKVAERIDREIHTTYKLMPTNYIAYDLLHQSDDYADHYSEAEKIGFKTYMESRIKDVEGEDQLIHHTFLKVYANPVENAE
jgi:hypothetical protein